VVHRHRRVRRLACETAPGADEKRAEHEHDVRIRETIVDEVQISKVAAVLAEWNPSVQGQTAFPLLMDIASKRLTSWLSACFGVRRA
jgi:hypothetical protein